MGVLVTGAGDFIGSHVAENIVKAGRQVIALKNRPRHAPYDSPAGFRVKLARESKSNCGKASGARIPFPPLLRIRRPSVAVSVL
jgi:nucleoside-diphosphate-sugar epimerase